MEVVYKSAQSRLSTSVYGKNDYAASITSAAVHAQLGISSAIFGTPTGVAEAAANSAASVGDQVYSAGESAASAVSEAIWGPEQNVYQSAQSRMSEAATSAMASLASFGASATGEAKSAASSASSVINEQVKSLRDEL
ncbi:hypothetical protein FH972_025057 [Carpinus fangiana]|uniref:Uncharacterized protein n=1 Tax=Carpinus fangiana TaxID=176857 RepID=A0A5N6KZX6_9ROSI|nr:hypothetical protein FH972_025057 [Carpinus fangiana]